jgi:hypothetical protein
MPIAEFLETYPLYRKFPMELPPYCNRLPQPTIHMHCSTCKSEQTFQMANEYFDRTGHPLSQVSGMTCRVIYKCAACNVAERDFMLFFAVTNDYVMKVGQHPTWSIGLDKTLSKMLGTHVKYYKCGLVCESQGYGIGAVAYYRRIVEEIIDGLLDSIETIISSEDHEGYKAALEATKKTIVTQNKIDLIKDIVPPILKPGGVNPLGVLHHALSEGLHDKDEDECLAIAETIRGCIVFLVNQVLLSQEQAKQFTTGMKKLLDKKSKPKTEP